MKIIRALFIGGLLAAGAVGCAHEAASGSPTTAANVGGGDGPAAAERGGPLYVQYCAKCHGNAGQGNDKAPPVVGQAALPLDPPAAAKYRKTQFHTARDVFDFVKANMPPTGDKLAEGQYLDILAFDLKANGVDLTGKMISPETLSAIVLHP